MLKWLMTGDVHMSNSLPHSSASEHGMTDRLQDQLRLWEQIYATIRAEGCEALLVAGDLFDKSLVDAVTLTHTVEAISTCPVPVYILAGNHDAVSTEGGRFTVEAFGKMGNNRIQYLDDKPIVHKDSTTGRKLYLWPLPYATMEETRRRLAAIRGRFKKKSTNILIFHNSVQGCEHVGWVCDDGIWPKELCEGFDYAIGGHFHTTQTFSDDERECGMYLGAPMQHRFDDEGRTAGYWVIEFTGKKLNKIKKTFVESKLPRFHTSEQPPVDNGARKRLSMASGDYLRIRVRATPAEFTKLKPALKEELGWYLDRGIKAKIVHVPVYHHARRLAPAKAMGSKSPLLSAIRAYPDLADAKGLDRKLLRKIGQEVYEQARKNNG